MTDARTAPPADRHLPVIVVGGGQAGLAMSRQLTERGIRHLIFEKNRVAHTWRTQRWDSFCLVTPNWQCLLPGFPYAGAEPHGFMPRDEIVAYIEAFARSIDAPVREGVGVEAIRPRPGGGFDVATTEGDYRADQVVMAISGYHVPAIPALAAGLPAKIRQIHSSAYRNPEQMPEGAVLVVGSGQSGCQIAEDLHLAGRKVHLAVGNAPRCARFYRGRDVVTWLADMGYYEVPVENHPLREGVRDNTNHYVTGRDGGRDIDLRKFAREGMSLYGLLRDFSGTTFSFEPTLTAALDEADRIYNGINAAIDRYIAETGIDAPPPSVYLPVWQPAEEPGALDIAAEAISAIVWCIGFQPDFRWLDAAVFNGAGHPKHHRGVTAQEGLYFLGLPWLHTWGSGRFSGVARDAAHLADRIQFSLAKRASAPARRALAG